MNGMNEWTIMFYIAGDNSLAPILVSQLKAITDAGFQENTDVLVHFDPNEMGVPTRIYEVNRKRKRVRGLRRTIIGDGRDPFVRNLDGDDIEAGVPGDPDAINAEVALDKFLDFCRRKHSAKRFILFLIGHGIVVGNDAFLPDDNPVSAITLKRLGGILKKFTREIKKKQGSLELLGMHSCSMSAIEVAYELKGTAKYMIASEGPQFVGSWPYRQLLKKIFNNLQRAKSLARNPSIDILKLVNNLYDLTFHNARDFLLAGYSHELALCSLDPNDFKKVTSSIKRLVAELIDGLKASNGAAATKHRNRIKELVLLAHLEAQSYWGENFTDLFDFCRCLRERCDAEVGLEDLSKACEGVTNELNSIVLRSRHLGSNVQFSHGLSIYFPWSRPIEDVAKTRKTTRPQGKERFTDEKKGILERYKEYAFTTNLGDKAWLSFLETYFEATKRSSRTTEGEKDNRASKAVRPTRSGIAAGDNVSPLAAVSMLPGPGKIDPEVGTACRCPSIKNYPLDPSEVQAIKERRR